MPDLRIESPDLEGFLEAAELVRARPRDRAAVVDLLAGLSRIVRCDVAFWHWLTLDPGFRTYALVQDPDVDTFEPDPEPWVEHLPEHPVMCGRYGPVVRISDVFMPDEFHRTWLYQEVFRVDGLRHEVGVDLPHGPGERNVVVLSRRRRDFSRRDRDVLVLLRPHLAMSLRSWSVPAALTPRQVEVMRLVAQGLSDAQVASRLGVSESTVGKHLEHVYERTGAHSRVEAVRRCSTRGTDTLDDLAEAPGA